MKFYIGLLVLLFGLLSLKAQSMPEKLSHVDDWQMTGEKQYFDASNLYDYINGASDFYLSYLFNDLWVIDYQHASGMKITLELYHHANSNCAFGIYAEERPVSVELKVIGAEGYVDSGAAYFLKGSYYVKIFSGNEQTGSDDMEKVAKQIATLLDGETQLPDVVSLFPKQGRSERSERFTAENYMGVEGFNDIFSSSYQVDNQQFKMFIISIKNVETCKRIDQYIANHKTKQKKGEPYILLSDEYNGPILIIKTDKYIKGIQGHSKPQKVKELLN